jgi:hypothetical protein
MLPNTKNIEPNEEPELPNTDIQNQINKSTGVEKTTEQTVLKQFYILQKATEVRDEYGNITQFPAGTKILCM